MKIIKKKESWGVFALKALISLALIVSALSYAHANFTIGIDDQKIRCLDPYKFFLVRNNPTSPKRDDLFAFSAQGMAPYQENGAMIIKQIRGVPGDHIKIEVGGTYINGEYIGMGPIILAEKLGKRPQDFVRTFTLKQGEYFFWGWHERSFDSRYWGPVTQDQLIGRATAIF